MLAHHRVYAYSYSVGTSETSVNVIEHCWDVGEICLTWGEHARRRHSAEALLKPPHLLSCCAAQYSNLPEMSPRMHSVTRVLLPYLAKLVGPSFFISLKCTVKCMEGHRISYAFTDSKKQFFSVFLGNELFHMTRIQSLSTCFLE